MQVSWGVGPGDVERAARRAKLLALAGLATMLVVSGNGITPEANAAYSAVRSHSPLLSCIESAPARVKSACSCLPGTN